MTRKTESKEPEVSKFQLFFGMVLMGCLFLGMLSGWSWSGLLDLLWFAFWIVAVLVLFLIYAYLDHIKHQRRRL